MTASPMTRLAASVLLSAALPVAAAEPSRPATVAPAESAPAPQQTRLTTQQHAIAPIAALAATGDMPALRSAIERALEAGVAINPIKEVLVQSYAYAGFPRSLNALGELLAVVEARKARGIQDAAGPEPSHAAPTGQALLAAGTANQTRLTGAAVTGPLFAFSPEIDTFLKTHLFGDIFERDNLDWRDREVATVSMLSTLAGAESQLLSHVRFSVNVGVSVAQLQHLADVLAKDVDDAAATRLRAALAQYQAQ